MKYLLLPVLSLALVACDSGQDGKDYVSEDAAKQAAEAAQSDSDSAGADLKAMADKAVDTVKAEADKMVAMAEAVELDMSSMDSFTSSLMAMKSQLNTDQVGQLTDALKTMAKDAVTDEKSGGLMGAAKDMMSGKSTEDVLYERMKDKLDGLTFDDIMAMVG